MHVLELGVLLYLFSAILWSLVEAGFFGAYNEAESDRINAEIVRNLNHFYHSRGVPFRNRMETTLKGNGHVE